MNCVLLIEQHGQQSAVKVAIDESNSICVGRSWQSDVIVTDKYVDAQHLKISANDNQFEIEDLGSENGTRLKKRPINGKTPYEFGTDIVVGETTLKLVDVNSSVEPAMKHDRAYRLFQKVGPVRSVILSTLFTMASIIVMEMWGFPDHTTARDIFGGVAIVFCVILGWSVIAGCARAIFRKQALFTLHWVFISSLLCLAIYMNLAAKIAQFNLNSTFASYVLDHINGATALCLLTYGTLTLVCKLKRSAKLAITVALLGFVLFSDIIMPQLAPEHERWSDRSTISHMGQPPAFFFGSTSSLDTHMAKTEKLFDQLSNRVEQ